MIVETDRKWNNPNLCERLANGDWSIEVSLLWLVEKKNSRTNINKILFGKGFCIQESFNTNISHQFFDYKITFVDSKCENTNSKDDIVLKNRV